MTRLETAERISHRLIIERAGGPAAVGRAINVEPNTTKAWKRLDSIPAPHWAALAATGIATLDELADAVARTSEEIATDDPPPFPSQPQRTDETAPGTNGPAPRESTTQSSNPCEETSSATSCTSCSTPFSTSCADAADAESRQEIAA